MRKILIPLFLLISIGLVSCAKTNVDDTQIVSGTIENKDVDTETIENDIDELEESEELDGEVDVLIDLDNVADVVDVVDVVVENDITIEEDVLEDTNPNPNNDETQKYDKEIKVEISIPETDEVIEVEPVVTTTEIPTDENIKKTELPTGETQEIEHEELPEIEPNIEVLDAYLNIDTKIDGYTLNYNLTGNIDIESHVFDQVNELRESLGISPLTSNNILVGAALTRSKELSELFSHTRPNGTEWHSIFDEIPYRFRACGENLTTGTGFTREQAYNKIFDSWYNSPGHYANMVNPDFKEIGIAVYFELDGTYYATQMFGTQFS